MRVLVFGAGAMGSAVGGFLAGAGHDVTLVGRGPHMERIHPRAMLDAPAWRRVRRSMLRAHRIYVTGNMRRYFYDWGMIACGPGAVGRDAAPDRLLGADGALATATAGAAAA